MRRVHIDFDGCAGDVMSDTFHYMPGIDFSTIKITNEDGYQSLQFGDSVSKGSALCLEYLQVMGSTFYPTFLYGYAGCTGCTIVKDVDRGSDAPPIVAKVVKECDVIPTVKIRGLGADYVVFDDWQNPGNIYTTGIVVHGDSIPLPSSVQVNFSEISYNPFPYLEMCGT